MVKDLPEWADPGWALGNHSGNNYFNYPFSGFIDETRFYDRALSAAEVFRLYSKESSKPSMFIKIVSCSNINLYGKPLTQDLVALGGTGFVWQVLSGTLPPGVSLNSSGQISGTPTAPGNYNFTVKVMNAEGFSAYRSMRIRIIPPSTFGGGYNFANFAGSPLGFSGSSDASFLGSGAASGGFTGSADGRTGFTGSADSAARKPLLYAPAGVAVDASGNIYVSDTANNQIRKISATGAISNVAGAFTGSGGGIFGYGGSLTIGTLVTIAAGSTGLFSGANPITLTGTSVAGGTAIAGAINGDWTLNSSMDNGALLTVGSFLSLQTGTTTRTLNLRGYGSTTFSGGISNSNSAAPVVVEADDR